MVGHWLTQPLTLHTSIFPIVLVPFPECSLPPCDPFPVLRRQYVANAPDKDYYLPKVGLELH